MESGNLLPCAQKFNFEYTLETFEYSQCLNPLNAELNPICHLLALLGAHHIFNVSRIRVNSLFYVGFILILDSHDWL
jgi:hypothetical protein